MTRLLKRLESKRVACDARFKFLTRCALCGIFISAISLLIGCGSSDGRVGVTGLVTLDGVPLDNGVITFFSRGERPASAGAAIQGGDYKIPAEHGLLPGKYMVAIDAADPGEAQARPDHPAMSIPVSKIPLRYNGETELSAELSAGGENRFDYPLESGRSLAVGQNN